MIHYTYEGAERVLATLDQGKMFGDFLLHSSMPFYPGNLVATKKSEIAFLYLSKFHQLMETMMDFRIFFLNQLSEKALMFNLHNKILMQNTLREKIMMWFKYQDIHDDKIAISSKEQMANYFNVARPSLSRELMHMKEDGLIDYDRHFIYVKL